MTEKKNWDLIAKIEKQIKEKYGEEAIKSPAQGWTDEQEEEHLEKLREAYLSQRENESKREKVEISEGFFVTKKLLMKESSRVCPVCSAYSFNKEDDLYMNKFDCCFKCYIDYVEGREDRWKTGWRPNKENKDG
jgi:hypothetical protein